MDHRNQPLKTGNDLATSRWERNSDCSTGLRVWKRFLLSLTIAPRIFVGMRRISCFNLKRHSRGQPAKLFGFWALMQPSSGYRNCYVVGLVTITKLKDFERNYGQDSGSQVSLYNRCIKTYAGLWPWPTLVRRRSYRK